MQVAKQPGVVARSSGQVSSHDEMILVVNRELLLQDGSWQGLKDTEFAPYLEIVKKHQEFLPRSIMETDFAYKQIIPYLIFTHDNRFFLMQRQAKATETRLASKFSLGIGGHINQEDITQGDIIEWSRREFAEEVEYEGNFSVEPLGIINDDSNPVGQVHIGFVFLLHGDSSTIRVRSELKSGDLYSLVECAQLYENMENWSKLVFDYLKKRY